MGLCRVQSAHDCAMHAHRLISSISRKDMIELIAKCGKSPMSCKYQSKPHFWELKCFTLEHTKGAGTEIATRIQILSHVYALAKILLTRLHSWPADIVHFKNLFPYKYLSIPICSHMNIHFSYVLYPLKSLTKHSSTTLYTFSTTPQIHFVHNYHKVFHFLSYMRSQTLIFSFHSQHSILPQLFLPLFPIHRRHYPSNSPQHRFNLLKPAQFDSFMNLKPRTGSTMEV